MDGYLITEKKNDKKSDIKRLRKLLKNGVVDFVYKKKDGNERKAKGTLKKSLIPETDRDDDRSIRSNTDCFQYFDLRKDDWRCFLKKNFIKIIEKES